eukprot:m.65821 g.65821  ORF g.65821 m.65821 type:complete len:148 (+) comp35331_c0_seq1:127-570(+)
MAVYEMTNVLSEEEERFFEAVQEGDLITEKWREAKNENGNGALALAACYGQVEAVKYLHSRGFDLNKTGEKKCTALHFAAEAGEVDVADYLLSQGVNFDVQDEDGDTPFLHASFGGQIGVMEQRMQHPRKGQERKWGIGRGRYEWPC